MGSPKAEWSQGTGQSVTLGHPPVARPWRAADEYLVAGAWPKRSTWSPVPVSLTPTGKGVEILLTVTWMADDAVCCFAVEHNRLDIVGLKTAF